MTRTEKIQEQITLANEVLVKKYNGKVAGMIVVVTASKANEKSRREYFGFRFQAEGNAKIGETIKNSDGTISKIESII